MQTKPNWSRKVLFLKLYLLCIPYKFYNKKYLIRKIYAHHDEDA